MHLVGFILRIYHDARSAERQITSDNSEYLIISQRSACASCANETFYVFMLNFGVF